MSTDDTRLRGALTRAADDVSPPDDPVGRVRATVERRRRRRSATRLAAASAGAAAALVGAVVLVPGQLGTDAAPPATSPTGEGTGLLLAPEGFPGIELGSRPDLSGVDETQLRPTGSGCTALDTRLTDLAGLRPESLVGTDLVVWLRDGVVVSVVAFAVPQRVEVPGDVPRTWVGPTLRSPLSTALDVPGARLVKDDPLGAAGPEVSNVVVDAGDGTELVLSDVPLGGQPSQGRVTTLVLRTEDGAGCREVAGEDFLLPGQGDPGGTRRVSLWGEGADGVRLGGSAAEAVAAGDLVAAPQELGDPLDGRGCTSLTSTADGLQVYAELDRIVGIASFADPDGFTLAADPAVASGQVLEGVLSRTGAVTARLPVVVLGEAVDVPVGPGVRARVVGAAVHVPAETTGVLVQGPALVDGVLLYEGDAPAGSLCGL